MATLAEQSIEGEGIGVRVEEVTPKEDAAGRRLLVTLLAPKYRRASNSERVFRAFAGSGATCERIVHLASYPVDCYELIVLGADHVASSRVGHDGRSRGSDSTSRSSAPAFTGARSTSW